MSYHRLSALAICLLLWTAGTPLAEETPEGESPEAITEDSPNERPRDSRDENPDVPPEENPEEPPEESPEKNAGENSSQGPEKSAADNPGEAPVTPAPDQPAGNPGEEQLQEVSTEVRRARNVALDQPITNEEAAAPASDPPDAPADPKNAANTEAPDRKTPEATAGALPAPEGPEAPAKEPVKASAKDPATEQTAARASEDETPEASDSVADLIVDPEPAPEGPAPFVMLGTEVPPATSTRLAWAPSQSFEGIYSATPVLVVNGAEPGPALCLTAAVHGDELNGVETVRRVLYNLDADKLKGTVVGVPIVNLQGFHRGSRYLSDRRDLNRYFPGDPEGSSASRIAHSFFHEVIKHCSAVVDLHTGSFYRTNLPQLRGDLRNPQVVKMTESFGSTVVLHSEGTEGTLRRAAVAAGIPAVTIEAGGPMVLNEDSVSHSVKGIRTLLNHLDMVSKFSLWGDPEPVYYNSTWQRAPEGGIVFSNVSLGQEVRKGDLLGTVTNPITNVRTEIRSSYDGRILGMAMNQVVQPGFATHHIGIKAPEEQISDPEDVPVVPPTEGSGPGQEAQEDPETPENGRSPSSAEDEDFEAQPMPVDPDENDLSPAEE